MFEINDIIVTRDKSIIKLNDEVVFEKYSKGRFKPNKRLFFAVTCRVIRYFNKNNELVYTTSNIFHMPFHYTHIKIAEEYYIAELTNLYAANKKYHHADYRALDVLTNREVRPFFVSTNYYSRYDPYISFGDTLFSTSISKIQNRIDNMIYLS